MGPEGLQCGEIYRSPYAARLGFCTQGTPHGVPFLFRSHDQSARLPGFRNVRLVVHQKLETSTSGPELLGWPDGPYWDSSAVKYTEAP